MTGRVVLRTGRKVGRTLYQQLGAEPSDADPLIGTMDTPELAALVVLALTRFMSESTPSDCDELASTLARLPTLLRDARRRRQISVRAAAEEAGVAFTTFSRCERGDYGTDRGVSTGCAIKLLRWVSAPDRPAGEPDGSAS